MRQGLRAVLQALCTLDLRSLAVLRMSLGLILVLDILLRWRDLIAHYTDSGVLSRTDLLQIASDPWWLSLHLAGGGWPFQAFLFSISALAGISLFLGYQTRAATVLSWLMLVSLQSRNPMLLNSGDVLLRVVLFWCIFLPCGAKWSVDSRRTPAGGKSEACSMGALAYTVQIALLYGFAASSKTGEPWVDGSAVYYALSIDQFQTSLGAYLLGFPSLLKYLTWSVVGFQWTVPCLLLSPLATRHTRLLAVIGLAAMHLGIGLSMHLGLFSVIAIAVTLGLLPGYVWSLSLTPKLRRSGRRLLDILHHRLPTPWRPDPFRPRRKGFQVLLGALLVYVIMWNFGAIPLKATWLGQLFRLDQHWSMFAPYPLVDDGWYVVEGELKNGKRIDLFRGTDVLSFEKPDSVAWTYPNERWRKYMMNLYETQNREHRELFLRFLAHRWNSEHRGAWEVDKARLHFVLERTLPQGTEPPRTLLLREYKYEKVVPRGEGMRQLFGIGS